MFDLSMGEIGLIAVVALVVIGPDKLPAVAKTAGTLMGKAQRFVNQVKNDIDREVELSELKKIQEDARKMASSIEEDLKNTQNAIQKEVDAVNESASKLGSELKAQTDQVSNDLRDSWASSVAPKSTDTAAAGTTAGADTDWGPAVCTIDTRDLDAAFSWKDSEQEEKKESKAVPARQNNRTSDLTMEDLLHEIEMLRAEVGKQSFIGDRRRNAYARGSRVNRTRINR